MKSMVEHQDGLRCYCRQASQTAGDNEHVVPKVLYKHLAGHEAGKTIEIGTTGGNIATAHVPYKTMAKWLLEAVETQPAAAKQLRGLLNQALPSDNNE